MDELSDFLAEVLEVFASDPTAPSVLLAKLPGNGGFYVSVLRYKERLAGGKVVVSKARDADALSVAILRCREAFLSTPEYLDRE
jgi:hypothetical protein